MEQFLEQLGNGLGNTITWLTDVGALFAIFAVVWVAFAVALVRSHGTIDRTWRTIRSLPVVVQLVLWLLFLPVMIGLWIWEATWPIVVRAALVLALAAWNLLMFLPRALQAPVP